MTLTKEGNAASKILVFSSWVDVLDLIAHALHANSISFAYPRGGKTFREAIADFRAGHPPRAPHPRKKSRQNTTLRRQEGVEGPVQTLLLLVKQGANGLNLTEAQHVILAEPILDPAVEAQAIGRVHRIGQTQDTWVHRFVVSASVEENVHELAQRRASAMDLSVAPAARKGEQQSLTLRDLTMLLKQDWETGEVGLEEGGPGGEGGPSDSLDAMVVDDE